MADYDPLLDCFDDDPGEEVCDSCGLAFEACACDDCGLMPNGQCVKVGSEECDWYCPHSRSPRYAGSAAWNQAHDAGTPIDGCGRPECDARLGAQEAAP